MNFGSRDLVPTGIFFQQTLRFPGLPDGAGPKAFLGCLEQNFDIIHLMADVTEVGTIRGTEAVAARRGLKVFPTKSASDLNQNRTINMPSNWRRARWVSWLALLSYLTFSAQAEEPNLVARMKELALPILNGRVPAYYSVGHREHAEKLEAAIEDMNVFYQKRLGVQADVSLALLDAKDWKRVTGQEYSLPHVEGSPLVIVMPATSDNPVFGLIAARKEAIPIEQLQAFLTNHHTTFAVVAGEFVDLIGFHELGHTLNTQFGIDSKDLWLNEFLANYWSYAYISERQPEWQAVFDLLGRPSRVRPKNTSLEDFERLYIEVDDYGWYQGMFEARVREICPQLGLKFLSDLKRRFPRTAGTTWNEEPLETRMKPAELLERLEAIAPGFQKWGLEFSSTPRSTTAKSESSP